MARNLDVKKVANTLAIVTAFVYVVCIVLLWVSPGFAVILGNYLFHGVVIAGIITSRGVGYSLVSLILGTVSAWVLGVLFAIVYNKL